MTRTLVRDSGPIGLFVVFFVVVVIFVVVGGFGGGGFFRYIPTYSPAYSWQNEAIKISENVRKSGN